MTLLRLTAGMLSGVLITSIGLTNSKAQTSTPPTLDALKSEMAATQKKLRDDYQEKAKTAIAAFQKAQREAKTDDEKAKARQSAALPMFNPRAGMEGFSPKFLAWAETHPSDPAAFDALVLALQSSGGMTGNADVWGKAIDALRAGYAKTPEMKTLVRSFGRLRADASDRLLREVVAQNPDRKIQALALKALADGLTSAVELAESAAKNDAMRQNLEKALGKVYIDREIAHIDRNRSEAESLKNRLRESYGDVVPNLSIGQAAPEVINQGLDGKPVKLSDLKGRVVVLDIWATWCGPCKQMIPHERTMVERLKDKPFTLVSISADEEKETLTKFLAKEPMPWTHWWNGNGGGMIEDWDVQYFPTIYVLDRKGVIRHKDLRGEELQKAVEELLKEGDAE